MTDTVALSTDLATPVDAPLVASWSRRVVAALLDWAILSGATWVVLGQGGVAPSLQPTFGGPSSGAADPVSWYTSGWLVGLVVAMLVLQGWTGATPGKRVAGVAVVRVSDGRPAGIVAAGLRVVAHVIDSILLIGYLRPLWNARGQTFADSMIGTLVIQTREPAAHPWFARFRREPSAVGSTVVSVAAFAVCVLGVGFSTSTSSWGGEWESALPCVDDGTVVAPTGTATAARAGGAMHEGRLWIDREVDDDVEKGLRITWAVAAPDGQLDGARVETDVRRADGSVIAIEQEVSVASGGGYEVYLDPAEVSADDLEDAGPGWSAQSRLLLEGHVVGACSIDAADWEAADQPDYGPPWTDG
ncbi:RDD family protein [Cellulomonas sp.]|uniref:RDD family protein n=1 Tax=Cellulomonas sp. TaxID=40001 RepID=UPI003BAC35C7